MPKRDLCDDSPFGESDESIFLNALLNLRTAARAETYANTAAPKSQRDNESFNEQERNG